MSTRPFRRTFSKPHVFRYGDRWVLASYYQRDDRTGACMWTEMCSARTVAELSRMAAPRIRKGFLRDLWPKR